MNCYYFENKYFLSQGTSKYAENAQIKFSNFTIIVRNKFFYCSKQDKLQTNR
ncbi:MAG: hypothetical protein OHK0057_28940 [Thermoflexibacter sp.]